MKTSVEISYYPLTNDFVPPIREFIHRLNQYSNLAVRTNGMSTQVFGEFRDVMNALTKEIELAFKNPHSVFVMKIINADLNTVESR